MKRIAILADDMTGAVDAGVQLGKRGIPVQVHPRFTQGEELFAGGVAAVNMELRHRDPAVAYEQAHLAAQEALSRGADILYIKTDSGLRGNIGPTLMAAADASGQGVVYVPAYPAMRRYTRNGVYYIDGRPVSVTGFGLDLYNAVSCDNLVDLLRCQGVEHVRCETAPEALLPARGEVVIADVRTEEELARIAGQLRSWDFPLILAGCAGFADHLHRIAQDAPEQTAQHGDYPRFGHLMIIVGSVTEQTFRQLGCLSELGVRCRSLTALIDGGKNAGEIASSLLKDGERCVVLAAACSQEEYARNLHRERLSGAPVHQRGAQIAGALGKTAAHVLRSGWQGAMMIVGGDTLSGVISEVGYPPLIPRWELFPGVALSSCRVAEQKRYLITKAGSFGGDSMLEDVASVLMRH